MSINKKKSNNDKKKINIRDFLKIDYFEMNRVYVQPVIHLLTVLEFGYIYFILFALNKGRELTRSQIESIYN